MPVYDAGGTADRSVSSTDLASRLEGKHVKVLNFISWDDVESHMREAAHAGKGALVTFGARDPDLPRLAKRLAGRG
jgi:hypothetical protein